MPPPLERSRRSLWRRIVDFALSDVNTIVQGKVDEDLIAAFEQVLLEADFGVEATMLLVEELERAASRGQIGGEEDIRLLLREQIRGFLASGGGPSETGGGPELACGAELGVVLVLGVNGVGKTTTAAKLAHRLQTAGDRVLLAAADTFRAGAQQQLETWAARVGADFVGGREGGDPAAVAFDALEAAQARRARWVLIDTAGRLHTQGDLMKELEKIDRVIGRKVEGAPHERLLVVDATSGQNVMSQAREFGASLQLTGLVLAKFDSSARAGTAVSVVRELDIPIRFLGVGETLDDLEPFSADRYVDKILADA